MKILLRSGRQKKNHSHLGLGDEIFPRFSIIWSTGLLGIFAFYDVL